jgi:spermidine synthase
MGTEHYKVILRSLLHVFPHVNVWLSSTDTIIIGSNKPFQLDFSHVQHFMRIPSVQEKLNSLGITSPEILLSFFYLDEKNAKAFSSGVDRFNLDRHPVVEFESPKYLLGPVRPDTLLAILEHSYTAELPLTGADVAKTHVARISARRPFYKKWRFPIELTDTVIRRSLQRPIHSPSQFPVSGKIP